MTVLTLHAAAESAFGLVMTLLRLLVERVTRHTHGARDLGVT